VCGRTGAARSRSTPLLRTANPRVFAAGDVTSAPQFVYVAAQRVATAAQNALRNDERTIDYAALPRITFTSPQIAAVGLTDEQAKEQGLDCSCRTLPLEHVPRALVERDTRGSLSSWSSGQPGAWSAPRSLPREPAT